MKRTCLLVILVAASLGLAQPISQHKGSHNSRNDLILLR